MAIKQVCFSVNSLVKFLHSAEAATLTGIIYMVQLTQQYYRLLYITVNHMSHVKCVSDFGSQPFGIESAYLSLKV